MHNATVDAHKEVPLLEAGYIPAQGGRGATGQGLQLAKTKLPPLAKQRQDSSLAFLSDHDRKSIVRSFPVNSKKRRLESVVAVRDGN
jgi:hypothetical protein